MKFGSHVFEALGTSTMESSKINFFEVWDSEWNLRTLDCEEWVKPIATVILVALEVRRKRREFEEN